MKIIKKSNCKINLDLKIIDVRDGYHILESVFCPISIYDDMIFEFSEKDHIVGMGISEEENIIYKTIKKFKKKYQINESIKVTVNKKIPMQAGLGGGSSNAAFTIKTLNEMFMLGLSDKEMIDFGKELGSDVPFFIINKPSRVQGRGEFITPIESFQKVYGLLVFDSVFMNTKEVFQKYDLIENKVDGENDLEQAVIKMPGGEKIQKIKRELIEFGCYKALMSGAGGSVFGLCKKEEIDSIYELVEKKYCQVWKFESL